MNWMTGFNPEIIPGEHYYIKNYLLRSSQAWFMEFLFIMADE
jgi:hypothetical protein